MKDTPEPIDDDLVDPDIAATIIFGDPHKKRRHWSDKPTAAEKRGAPQGIPAALWDRIAHVRLDHAAGKTGNLADNSVAQAWSQRWDYLSGAAIIFLHP